MTFTGTKTEISQFLYKLDKDTKYDIKIDKHRNKRSLDANAYSWVLQTEIANVLRISKEEVHFDMLKAYGQRDYVSLLANVNIADYYNYYEEVGTFRQNNNTFKSYMIYKGTHNYDSKEMSIFIDGVVQEARNLGIETLEDREINELIREMEDGRGR
jgi:hypothetical protein